LMCDSRPWPRNRYPRRVVSLAEHEQLAFAVVRCQPKDIRYVVVLRRPVAASASRRDEVVGIDF